MPALPPVDDACPPEASTLRDLALRFLRLGATSLGGPAAHVAMMEREVVEQEAWLSRESFLDLVGATQLIPGPNSTELAMHLGWLRGGWRGLLVAGSCFILPAALLVGACAWLYARTGDLPAVATGLRGAMPVVLAIIAVAVVQLGRSALTTRGTLLVAGTAFVGALAGVHELLVLAAAATFAMVGRAALRRDAVSRVTAVPLVLGAVGAVTASAPSTSLLGLLFLRIGATLFGSGYVLVAFLRSEFVQRLGWLSERQLLDAIAVGQFTPGPVFTTATFIGYLLQGWSGAVVATVAIFLPGFVLVALTAPHLAKLRTSPLLAALLDAVNAASLGLMAAVCVPLARGALTHWSAWAIGLVALALLLRTRINSAWLVAAGIAIGVLLD